MADGSGGSSSGGQSCDQLACDACPMCAVEGNCAGPFSACSGDPDCMQIFQCCSDSPDGCAQCCTDNGSPPGIQLYTQVAQCVSFQCTSCNVGACMM
jgi:hypothetical protein